jgi:hypothetical protein
MNGGGSNSKVSPSGRPDCGVVGIDLRFALYVKDLNQIDLLVQGPSRISILLMNRTSPQTTV